MTFFVQWRLNLLPRWLQTTLDASLRKVTGVGVGVQLEQGMVVVVAMMMLMVVVV